MSGSDGQRGYLVQTLVSLLEAIQDTKDWESFILEPEHEDAIDIIWQHPNFKKVVQVKSSKNPFKPGDVKTWCSKLKSKPADIYELVLVGPAASPSVAKLDGFEGVRIPAPKPLDISGMIKQIAYDLGVYCEHHNIPPTQPSTANILADALVGMLARWSVESKEVTRKEWAELLKKWIFLLLPKISTTGSTTSFDALKIVNSVQLPQLEAWVQPLLIGEIKVGVGVPLQRPEYELQNLLNKFNQITLLGRSGSGKSCVMQMAAHILNQEPENLCFWIPLKLYAASLIDTIKGALGWHRVENNEIMPILERHNIILMLDGLDEVSENEREKCATEIQQLFHSYKGKLCVSYPITDWPYFNFECPAYEVLPLTERKIVEVVESYFEANGDPDKAKWFFRTIRGWTAEQKKDFDALAQMPINLQLLLELAANHDFQYSSLRDLHGQVIKKRLRSVEKREKAGNIQPETKLECLKVLAFHSIVEGYSQYMLKAWVQDILSDYLNSTDKNLALKEIVRNDLLREANELYVEWPHSSYRDYLAGLYLFEQLEMEKSIDDFPIGKFQAIGAGAHAVKFATERSITLKNRHKVFLSILQNKPIFEAVQAAAVEYHTAVDNYISTDGDLQVNPEVCKRIGWGERFLEAYYLIAEMARREKFSNVEKIPRPKGVILLFDSENNFCLAVFSYDKGVYFGQLENFEAIVTQMKKQQMPVWGFCLYAPFLLRLDPEIIAYLQVGVWLRLRASSEDDKRLSQWHDSLTTYLAPKNDWLNWYKSNRPPASKPRLQATEPKEAIDCLIRSYPNVDIDSLLATTNLHRHPGNKSLSWQEIYNPITFEISPSETQWPTKPVSNRLSQLFVLSTFPTNVSLALLMPRNYGIDLGANISIPFPTQPLNRYYFLDNSNWNMANDNLVTYVHLRG